MPQDLRLMNVLLTRPKVDEPVNLPEDPNEPAAKINRFVNGLLNGPFVRRRKGANNEIPEMLGAGTAAAIPIAAVFRAIKNAKTASGMGNYMLREHMVPELPAEFAPTTVGQQPPLTIEEANKMMELMKPNPAAVGGPGRVSTFAPERFSTSSSNTNLAKQKASLDAYRRNAAVARGE